MDSFTIWHWFVVILVVVGLYGYPIARIIRRTGHSRWWVIAFFVPVINVVAFWVLALARWPSIAVTRA